MTFTDEQKKLINSDSTKKYVHVSFPNHEIEDIENDRIYLESMSLEESLIDQDNLVFGKCNSALFTIKVADFIENIDNAYMDVSITLQNDSMDISLEYPVGKFIVTKTERTADRRWRVITASDYMTLFDVDILEWYNTVLFPTDDTVRTVDEILKMLCEFIGVEYDTDFKFIHGDLKITKNIQSTQLSGRDFLQQLCEANACFGHFNEQGVLSFVMFEKAGLYPSETLYPSNNLYPRGSADTERLTTYKSCEYEDYDVKSINSVQIRTEDDDIGVTATKENADAINKYMITGNSFLIGLAQEDMQTVADNLLLHMKNLTYRPNTTVVHGGLYLTLGKSYIVNTTTDTIESYILKRKLDGIQAISNTIEASGDEWLSETSNDITSEITIIKGKASKLKRDVEGLELDFIDYENKTETSFKQTAESIETQAKKIDEQGQELSSQIEQTAKSITQTVLGSQGTWDIESYSIKWYGNGTDSELYSDGDTPTVGDYYLDVDSGLLYKLATVKQNSSNEDDDYDPYAEYYYTVTYTKIKQLQTVQSAVESQIEQLADSITLKVENGTAGKEASIVLSVGENETSGKIDLTGAVTFSNLSTSGQTEINGANIKTGTLSADKITTGTLDASKVSVTNLNASNIKTGTISCDMLSGGTLKGQTISGGSISSSSGEYETIINSGIVSTNQLHIATVPSIGASIIVAEQDDVEFGMISIGTDRVYIDKPMDIGAYLGYELAYKGLYCNKRGYFNGAVCPDSDADHPCGTSDYRWSNVYCKNSSINTSDETKKREISTISGKYEDLFFLIEPLTYMFNDGDRVHIGTTAQRLKKSMDEVGLTNEDLSAYCEDVKTKPYRNEDSGEVTSEPDLDENGNEQYVYGIRYEEFVMLNTHMIQKAYKKIEEQQTEIDTLKQQVSFLMEKIGGGEIE